MEQGGLITPFTLTVLAFHMSRLIIVLKKCYRRYHKQRLIKALARVFVGEGSGKKHQ